MAGLITLGKGCMTDTSMALSVTDGRRAVSGLEVAAIGLGTAVAKAACGMWLGDKPLHTAVGNSLIDTVAGQLTGAREQRRFRRMWEQTAELVADRIEPLLAHEFRELSEHERLAAVGAVESTFDRAALTEADLFAQDLDAGYLDRFLRSQDPDRTVVAGLAADAVALYDLLLRESCAYTIELARTLPGGGMAALTELLRRERQLLGDMRTVLERLPARRGMGDFARDYRQLVAGVLDQVELFGATLAESSRRYPLSVAYLSLTVSGDFNLHRRQAAFASQIPEAASEVSSSTAQVEDVLAASRRLFIRGEAGSGKTTLLQWIAVHSARRSFPTKLTDWNDTVPFFIALRRHAEQLPGPERFVTEVGRHIAAEMPAGWVHEHLRSGKAVVLVDGVDELTERRRDEARRWLRELIAAFPQARYVVTTRPAAVAADWLGRADFDVAELEPMSGVDIPVFVHRWHEAMRDQCDTDAQKAQLTGHEQRLLATLAGQRHLRGLARSPLLCALLCALHRDRRGHLPGNRMELYEVALQMLLERRDRERDIERNPGLTRTDQSLLLRDLAYRLIRNGWASAPTDRVREWLAAKLTGMAQITASADAVYRLLLERSGLLREPVAGQTDFVHRSFQEYLAAAEAVTTDDIGALVANAWTDLWSDVVVMAAGHATAAQRVELIGGLLDRADSEQAKGHDRLARWLRLVAVACLETSPELPRPLRARAEAAVGGLLPPGTVAVGRVLAKLGGFTLDLLARTQPQSAAEVVATIRTAAEISDPAALPLLARFGRDARKTVVRELLRAWPRFDPEEYARTVLTDHPLSDGHLTVEDRRLLPALRHLRHLHSLRVSVFDNEPVDIHFIRDLSKLAWVNVPDLHDLGPLAGTAVEGIWQSLFDRSSPEALSLAPLADLPQLRSLGVAGRKVSHIDTLHQLTQLDTLYLFRLDSAAAVEALTPLRSLQNLGVGAPDLVDLRPICTFEGLGNLAIESAPAFADLSGVTKWSATLASLQYWECPAVDLTPLASLHQLRSLVLRPNEAVDLSAIRHLPKLAEVMLGNNKLPDLAPLAQLSTLARLKVIYAAEVDLSPLAGREGLQVTVGKRAIVEGTELLGAGSRVTRFHI